MEGLQQLTCSVFWCVTKYTKVWYGLEKLQSHHHLSKIFEHQNMNFPQNKTQVNQTHKIISTADIYTLLGYCLL